MNSKDRKKMMAVGMLAVYMLSVFAMVIPNNGESDAADYITLTEKTGELEIGQKYLYVISQFNLKYVSTTTKNGATLYADDTFTTTTSRPPANTAQGYVYVYFIPNETSVSIEVTVNAGYVMFTYTLTYTAVYHPKYTINYDGNGGTPSTTSEDVDEGSSTTLPTATRENHRILGWYTSSTGGTFVGQPGSSYTPTDNVILYAHWQLQHTVTLNANGGGVSSNIFTMDAGQSVTLPTPTWEHHRFLGWYNGNTLVTSPYTPTQNVTLTAHWEEIPVVITFKGQNDHTIATLTIQRNTTPMVFTPNFDDAIFTGWFYDQSFTQPYDPTTPLSQDTTLYAQAMEYLRFTSNPISNGVISTLYNSNMFVFDATPSESAMSIVWDFGDGTTSTDRIAYHTYAEHGTYQVTLTSTNYYGQEDSVTYEVIYGSEAGSWSFTSFAVGFAAVMVVALLVARRV